MVKLGGAISEIIIQEYSRKEFLRRLADPFFFQSLGCVMGFDFHSSGLTTTTMGALKEAIKPEELGIAVCGGKGRVSRRTPDEIQEVADVFSLSSSLVDELKRASRMTAKVDNVCIQDGYQLYHHTFVLSEDGDWVVIQQGMRERFARRYHWLSEHVNSFVEKPHSGIVSDREEETVLDMTAEESEEARKMCVDLTRENPERLFHHLRAVKQRFLDEYLGGDRVRKLVMPSPHTIRLSERTAAALRMAYEFQPENYEELIAIHGIGPKAVRALALVSELIYGKPPSWKDPAKFSFAHGGKDGVPYPVNRKTYQKTVEILESAINAARVGQREKLATLKRLHEFLERDQQS